MMSSGLGLKAKTAMEWQEESGNWLLFRATEKLVRLEDALAREEEQKKRLIQVKKDLDKLRDKAIKHDCFGFILDEIALINRDLSEVFGEQK